MPIIPRKKKYTDKQILQAITNSKGLLYIAAKSLGCNACTLHDRANKNPVIREAIDNERGEILDWSEAKLVSAVKNGEAWAVGNLAATPCFFVDFQNNHATLGR